MNKSVFKNSIWVLFICLLFVGCGDNEDATNNVGTLILGVEKNELLYTKAGVPVTNEILNVSFINSSDEVVKSYTNYKEQVEGQRIILPTGNYTVIVSSDQKGAPQWDTPSYYGETEVNISSGKITNASVECSITNTKVTVKYTESVDKYFSDYEAVVAGKSGKLTYKKGENRAGFYFTESLDVTLNLVNKNNGLKFQFNKLFPDIQPRYHYILKFDLLPPGEGGENSGGEIGVTINKTDSTEIECTILIPEYTQLMDIPAEPLLNVTTQLSGKEITNSTSINFAQSDFQDIIAQHEVTITTDKGVRNIYLKLSESFVKDGLPAMFDWLQADNSIKDKLKISGSETADKKYVYTLNLTDMVNNYLRPNESSSREYAISVIAIDKYHQEIETHLTYTVRPNLPIMSLDLTDQDKWATFAVLKGICSSDGTNIQFKYGKKNESEDTWSILPVTPLDTEGNISAMISGLLPETDYSFKVQATMEGSLRESNITDFKTVGTPVVPNLNFDDWVQGSPNNSWFLGADINNLFWDSGNKGANTLSTVNPTSKESSVILQKEGNKAAAKLASKEVNALIMKVFAAGNIYTGKFGEAVLSGTNSGATLNFGKPYIGKPTKLTGHYMYQPGTIDKTGGNYAHLIDKQDTCSIYIALCDWDKPFEVNTMTGTFIDFSSADILAYGELDISKCGTYMNAYEPFEIDITYRDITRTPKYVVIVASASKYGDYFTGSTSSVLYLDEFELNFDYNPASFIGTGSVLENN